MRPALLWFRRNLRLADNAALFAAVESGRPLIPLYVEDSQDRGAASRWWLYHSLSSLDRDLRQRGSSLLVRSGSPEQVLAELVERTGAQAIYYTRRFEPESRRQEENVAVALAGRADVNVYDDSLLHPPDTVRTQAGTPYRVFTAFWKSASGQGEPDIPLPAPQSIIASETLPDSRSIDDLRLLDVPLERAAGYEESWAPGEAGGLRRIDDLDPILSNYAAFRDRPDVDATSRLSPHLCFGEVSARQVWQAARQLEMSLLSAAGGEALRRQLYWRDFSSYLLFHFPALPDKPLRDEFEYFPWSPHETRLQAWQQGLTGYPLVDAGMRQLRQTGWMHNRVRMIAASFLVKDLLIPWQTGAEWFLDNLVDADLANNSAGWQWVAGCGADAAPFFRIFNPTLQRKKFDPNGRYVGRWVRDVEQSSYPTPILDHAEARRVALDAYESIRGIRTSNRAP